MSKRTPLYNEHIKLNARMIEFAGWEMPVQYTGVIDEHLAVRSAAGIFDVSHMGEFEFRGPGALACVQNLTTYDVSGLSNGQAHYSLLLNERGTIVDDIIVYRFSSDHFLMVVNAANIDKDWAWVTSYKKGEVRNLSDDFALIALQGPAAAEILRQVTKDVRFISPSPLVGEPACRTGRGGGEGVDGINGFHFAWGTVAGVSNCILARTGYTGEDGFEIFCKPADAAGVWTTLMERGSPRGLKPVGLGARDTLRTEMKYSLYGQDIDETTNPLEAGLGWVVKLEKDFIGKEALLAVKQEGLKRKSVGFQMIDPGIPRHGYKIYAPSHSPARRLFGGREENGGGGEPVGTVTSGTMSPSLKKAIGIGYVPIEFSTVGSKFFVDIRGRERLAEVVETPFYKIADKRR